MGVSVFWLSEKKGMAMSPLKSTIVTVTLILVQFVVVPRRFHVCMFYGSHCTFAHAQRKFSKGNKKTYCADSSPLDAIELLNLMIDKSWASWKTYIIIYKGSFGILISP